MSNSPCLIWVGWVSSIFVKATLGAFGWWCSVLCRLAEWATLEWVLAVWAISADYISSHCLRQANQSAQSDKTVSTIHSFILFHYHLVSCHSCPCPLTITQDNIENTHTYICLSLSWQWGASVAFRGAFSHSLSFAAIVPYSFTVFAVVSVASYPQTHASIQTHRSQHPLSVCSFTSALVRTQIESRHRPNWPPSLCVLNYRLVLLSASLSVLLYDISRN